MASYPMRPPSRRILGLGGRIRATKLGVVGGLLAFFYGDRCRVGPLTQEAPRLAHQQYESGKGRRDLQDQVGWRRGIRNDRGL